MVHARDDLLMHRFMRGVDRYRWCLFIAIGLMYLAAFNGQLRVGNDVSWYMTVGTNLAEGRGYTYHGQQDTVSFPGVPLMVAAGRAVSDQHGTALTHAMLMGMSLLTLIAAYRLFLLETDRPAAALAVVVLSCTHRMFEHSVDLLTDGPFTLGVVLALWGYARLTRDKPWAVVSFALLGAGLGVAAVSRVMMMALVMALGVVCLWRVAHGPGRLRHVGVGLLIVVVVAAFYVLDPRRPEAGYTQARTYEAGLVRYITDPLPVVHQTLTRFVPMLFDDAAAMGLYAVRLDPITGTLASCLVLGLGVIGVWRRPVWAWFFAINIAVMLLFTPNRRYFLPLLPMIVMGLVSVFHWLGTRPASQLVRGTLPGLTLSLVLVPNVVKNIGLIIEQRRVPFEEHYKDGRFVALRELGQSIAQHVEPGAVVLAEYAGPLTMFSGDRTVYNAAMIEKLRRLNVGEHALDQSQAVYVVAPPDEPLEQLLSRWQVELGPQIARVPRLDAPGDWTLHRAVRLLPRDLTDPPDHGAPP